MCAPSGLHLSLQGAHGRTVNGLEASSPRGRPGTNNPGYWAARAGIARQRTPTAPMPLIRNALIGWHVNGRPLPKTQILGLELTPAKLVNKGLIAL